MTSWLLPVLAVLAITGFARADLILPWSGSCISSGNAFTLVNNGTGGGINVYTKGPSDALDVTSETGRALYAIGWAHAAAPAPLETIYVANYGAGRAVTAYAWGDSVICGENLGTNGAALYGISNAGSGTIYGLYGEARNSPGGVGVYGIGKGVGVRAESADGLALDVVGSAEINSNSDADSLLVFNNGNGRSLHTYTLGAGDAIAAGSLHGRSLWAASYATTETVRAENFGGGDAVFAAGYGPSVIFAESVTSTDVSTAVVGQSTASPSGTGVHGIGSLVGVKAESTSGTALQVVGNGTVSGNLDVTGTLTAGSKLFRIDHPLDPANKYLNHSCVESNEQMNVYSGVAVLDQDGQAVVTLPNWFEALNRDFRYQLTAMRAPMPNLYVADEIAGNRFVIAGGQPGGKVSWQVTGVRQDPFSQAHPLVVEEDKQPGQQGQYLHPEVYGTPAAN